MGSYFYNHWSGRLSFGWVLTNLLGVSAGLGFLLGNAGLLGVGVLGCVAIWQVCGGVRFAERILRNGADGRVWVVYGAIITVVFICGAQIVSLILPAPPPNFKIDGYVTKVTVVGSEARIVGEIDYRVLTQLKAAVGAGGVETVVLDSSGGHVIAGRSIGLYIERLKLETRVDVVCYSACTLAFMGGVVRQMGPDAVLGFHGYRYDIKERVQTVDWREMAKKDRVFLMSRGVSEAFVTQIFKTPSEQLWRPDRHELSAAGVLTR